MTGGPSAAGTADQGAGDYLVTLFVGERVDAPMPAPHLARAPGLVVSIGGAAMGCGPVELGEILIKGFLYTLSQLDTPPDTLLLFNGGVTLAAPGANTLADLETLASRGTRIQICGTCTGYYDITPAVGEIANMLEIVETMQQAEQIINL